MTQTPIRPAVTKSDSTLTAGVDTNTWPSLAPISPTWRTQTSARIARKLFTAAINKLDVTVHLGDTRLGKGGPEATIHNEEEFFTRLGQDQLIGFGEAYMTGAWDAENLGAFLTVLAAQIQDLIPAPLQTARALVVKKPPTWTLGHKTNTTANIAHHYDLSNDLFSLFLDSTLSYSAALWPTSTTTIRDTLAGEKAERLQATPPDKTNPTTLQQAQINKINRLLDSAEVTDGTQLLEIGTGWGELAIQAARRGAHVTTITLSIEQQKLAQQRIEEAGLTSQIKVLLQDYRDVQKPPNTPGFDAVISVEMLEAVGYEYWPSYFKTLERVLAPGGKAAVQTITMPHNRMLATRNTYTWIHKYIFPGGFLPSVQALKEVTDTHTTLQLQERFSFGSHYAETLRLWDEAFLASTEQVHALGFDDTFIRMWHFYLEYSRSGFASGYLDDYQLLFKKP